MCECVAANPDECLDKRHNAGINLAKILGGCTCKCHFNSQGAELSAGMWRRNRQQAALRGRVKLIQETEKQ